MTERITAREAVALLRRSLDAFARGDPGAPRLPPESPGKGRALREALNCWATSRPRRSPVAPTDGDA